MSTALLAVRMPSVGATQPLDWLPWDPSRHSPLTRFGQKPAGAEGSANSVPITDGGIAASHHPSPSPSPSPSLVLNSRRHGRTPTRIWKSSHSSERSVVSLLCGGATEEPPREALATGAAQVAGGRGEAGREGPRARSEKRRKTRSCARA
jgi:hypothetical protein